MTLQQLTSVAGILLLAWSQLVSGQSVDNQFEVASLKPSASLTTGMSGFPGTFRRGGEVSMRNVTLLHLLALAYSLPEDQIEGGPGWITTSRYDIEARPGGRVPDSRARLMLQTLLAERFRLRVHLSSTTRTGYRLVQWKGRPKLEQSRSAATGFRIFTAEELKGPGTMALLAGALSLALAVPVHDHTQLDGTFDIHLTWKPDNLATEDEPALSIFTALKSQLGLELKPQKVSVKTLIVDAATREPLGN